MLNIHPCQ